MQMILAHPDDCEAHRLVSEGAPGTVLITPRDLSRSGWLHVPLAPERDTAALGTRIVPADSVDHIQVRIAAVRERDLPHIEESDRKYVAAEMTAFLLAWLSARGNRVATRPSALALCGLPDSRAVTAGGLAHGIARSPAPTGAMGSPPGRDRALVGLLGPKGDGPLDALADALNAIGAPWVFFDQDDPTLDVQLDASGSLDGWIRIGPNAVPLSSLTSLYYRWHDRPLSPQTLRPATAWAALERLTAWADATPALVVNRPSAMGSNLSKRYGDVIYKSSSGWSSRVRRLQPSDTPRLARVASCPTQFQEWIEGDDVRVHVVGAAVYAHVVRSPADDYRHSAPGERVDISAGSLPLAVEERCRALAHSLDLPLAGIDLRRTPAGDWFCFEANPSPVFSFYERQTRQPVARTLARLLVVGG